MLLDTGAWNNLVGDRWVKRMDEINAKAGRPTHVRKRLPQNITLGGVGKNTQTATHEVVVHTMIDGMNTKFEATVLEDSDIPAILGMRSMQEKHGVIDLRNNRLLLPDDPADIKIVVKNKCKVFQLRQAPGGYLMLPCSPGTNSLCKPTDYHVQTDTP